MYVGNVDSPVFICMIADVLFSNVVIEVDAYIEMIKFFTLLILNSDESTAL